MKLHLGKSVQFCKNDSETDWIHTFVVCKDSNVEVNEQICEPQATHFAID